MSCSCILQLLSAVNCWLKCMLLDPYNQTDHPECKSRPDSGLSAITELDPGYITGIPFMILFIFLILVFIFTSFSLYIPFYFSQRLFCLSLLSLFLVCLFLEHC